MTQGSRIRKAAPPPEARQVLDKLGRGEWMRVKLGDIESKSSADEVSSVSQVSMRQKRYML